MQKRSIVATGGVLLLAVVMLAPSVSTAHSMAMSIAEARQQPLGTEVTVEGSVTVPSGTFSSATFDQGFAIQDETAGIYVSVGINLNLQLNKRVSVTGRVQDDGFGLLILKPDNLADVEVLQGAQHVAPDEVETGEIGEDTEGSLVRVVGTVTQPIRDDRPFGFGVFIDDGSGEIQVFIHVSSGINPFKIPFIQEGQAIQVRGFSGQFLQFLEVSPRMREDIEPAH